VVRTESRFILELCHGCHKYGSLIEAGAPQANTTAMLTCGTEKPAPTFGSKFFGYCAELRSDPLSIVGAAGRCASVSRVSVCINPNTDTDPPSCNP
jgi:hypothetical protein